MIFKFYIYVAIGLVGINWMIRKKINASYINIIFISIFALACIDWFELWYGSTFY